MNSKTILKTVSSDIHRLSASDPNVAFRSTTPWEGWTRSASVVGLMSVLVFAVLLNSVQGQQPGLAKRIVKTQPNVLPNAVPNAVPSGGLNRLLQQSDINQQYRADDEGANGRSLGQTANAPGNACLIPNTIEAAQVIQQVAFQEETTVKLADSTGFVERNGGAPGQVMPLPIGRIERARAAARKMDPRQPQQAQFHVRSTQQEYLFDGSDRDLRTTVDSSWNVHGLDTEDTVGHFDTLDGQRIVTPSNRVAIYAPQFAAVRKLSGAVSAGTNLSLEALGEKMQTVYSAASDQSSTTKQHLALNRHRASKRASGLLDQTRGVVADNTTTLFGFRNAFEPYANTALIRAGRYHRSQGPILAQGMQAAVAWETDLGLRAIGQNLKPVIVRDVKTVRELLSVESEDGTAILRVVKVADKIAARTGEEVEFAIRFDNISKQKIGNVTLMDNLTRRLEYVPDSAECSVKAEFLSETNEDDSLLLRWEVTDPLEAGTGGVIRFRCRVR